MTFDFFLVCGYIRRWAVKVCMRFIKEWRVRRWAVKLLNWIVKKWKGETVGRRRPKVYTVVLRRSNRQRKDPERFVFAKGLICIVKF